jgi:CSLREA domain-containing protein
VLALLAALLGSAIVVIPAYASTVVVTKTADTNDGVCDSDCSLREAIATAGVGATITFNPALSGGTIYLGSTLTLSSDIIIDGSALASQITISGDSDNNGTGDVRVFFVNSGVTATLDSLAITKGSNLFGGGIRNQGTLTVTNSTLSGNAATSGGGIFNTSSGTLTITNSTLSGNAAGSQGGGIHSQGTLTATNSTLSGNAAGSGGGIFNNGGVLNFANTLIANSSAGGDCVNGGTGTIGTNTNNLVEDGSCSTNGTNFLSGDPNLGSLADNGGTTQTFALLTGSPAIDAGDDTVCDDNPGPNNLDQRGVARPQGAHCDIGAYEYQYQSTVTKLADTNDGVCDSDCSLREAIATAAYRQTITFASSLSGGTIHLGSTLNIAQSMTIDGSALASKITVSGDSDSNGTGDVRVFFVHSGTTVTLDSLIITKGNGTALSDEGFTGGGGIQSNTGNIVGPALTVKNSIISGNSADNGGGIFNKDGSTLTITNSTISGNTATGDGGGLYSDGNLLAITDSTISGNAAAGDGGGVRNGNIMTLTNSTISGNSATGSGGGIRNAGNLTAKNNTLSGNSASVSGGGIFSDNTFNATNNIIANSTSGGDCSGEIDTNVNNLLEDGTCSGNSTNFVTGDPSLDSLANNGGSTQTFALLVGSPAIDAGDDATCTTSPVSGLDQRGVARPVGAHCDIGAFEGAKDISAPTVTSFTATTPSSSLNIPITAFTASDNVAVSGYQITESSTPPAAGAAGWSATAPASYTVGSDGSYTLYPWVKDAAGNVSPVFGSPASVSVDASVPTVVSSVRADPDPSTAASVNFIVTFSESVTGVDPTDFSLTTTGAIGGAAISGVSGSGSTYTVTVNTGSGSGTIRLDVADNDSIVDAASNPLGGAGAGNGAFISGETYTIHLYSIFLPLVKGND